MRTSGRGLGSREPPSQACAEVCLGCPAEPHTARGGTWTSGTSARTPWASALGEWPGQSGASSPPSSLNVLGSASTSARPAAARAAVSRPANRSRKMAGRARSSTGWISGRSARQSRAETRWIVERIRAIRTTCRLTSNSARSPGWKPSSRDHSP